MSALKGRSETAATTVDPSVTLEYASGREASQQCPPTLVLVFLALVPIVAWVYNALFIAPVLSNSSGEFAFIEFGRFVLFATPPMYLAQIVAVYLLGRYGKRRLILIFLFLMNLTPLCYLKILLVGPAFRTFF